MRAKDKVVIEISKQYIKIASMRPAFKKGGGFISSVKPIASFDDKALSNFIANTLASLKLKPRAVVLSLPRNLITVRVLSLPSDNPKEIAKMLDLHLVRLVPYKKEEMIISYSVLYTDEIGYTKIFLCIVHKDVLERQFKILADAGLFADKIYPSSYGVWEWMLGHCKFQMTQSSIYLGVDVSYDFTELIAFSKDNLFFSRSIVMGSSMLRQQENFLKFIREIKQAMIFLKSEYKYKKPEKILISGAIKGLESLQPALEKELEIPAMLLSIESWLNKVKSKETTIPASVSITTLKEFLADNPKRISFSSAEMQTRKAIREEAKDLVVAGSLFLFIIFVICGIFLGRIYNRQTYLKTLQSYSKNIGEGTENLMQQSKHIDFIQKNLNERSYPLLFFQEIHREVPDQVAIRYISMDKGSKVVLRGESSQLSDVFGFIGVLEDNPLFDKVDTKYTRKRKTREGEFTNFELQFVFNPSTARTNE